MGSALAFVIEVEASLGATDGVSSRGWSQETGRVHQTSNRPHNKS